MAGAKNSDVGRNAVIEIPIDEFIQDQNPLHGHTVTHARAFWRKFRLQDVVEENVFVRGFLAFQRRDSIRARLPRGNDVVNPNIGLKIGDHVYTHTEIVSLKRSWSTHIFTSTRKDPWIRKQWNRFQSLGLELRQLSGQHALLLVMCMFAAITQGMDQASMAGANISAPEALNMNITSTAASSITSKLDSGNIPLTINTWRFGAINGAPFLMGSVTGLLITDPLSEYWRWGRCGTIFIAGLISFATVIASASIHEWWELLICRLCLGVGMAGKAAIVPILLSETAPKHMRGFLVMSWQLLDAFGIAAASVVNIAVYHLNPTQSWRWMFIAAGIPALLLFSLVPFCQESPRWLLKRGDKGVKDALESLKALHSQPSPIVACGELYLLHTRLRNEQRELHPEMEGATSDVGQTVTSGIASGPISTRVPGTSSTNHQLHGEREPIEMNEITTTPNPHNEGRTCESSYTSTAEHRRNPHEDLIPSIVPVEARTRLRLMRKPHMRRANYAAAAVMISQQLCGINLLAFLSSTFFRNSIFRDPDRAGREDNYKLLGLSAGFGLVNFLATLFAAPYIDVPRRGRRYLLNLSFPLMAVCLLISGLLLLAPARDDSGRAKPVVIAFHYVFLIAFTIAYSIGEGPAAFVIASEVFQSVNRELGMSLAVFWNFMGAGLLATLAPVLTKYEGQSYLLIGCFGTNLIAWLACFILVPDTVNRELEDMVQRFKIPTKAATIFHLGKLRYHLCRRFGGSSEEWEDIEDWYQRQADNVDGEEPRLSWSLIMGGSR